MENKFQLRTDNPVFRFMGKLGDTVLLNLVWLLCSLPVVTLGASSTALFFVTGKMSRGEEYRLFRDFFRSFRENLRQATVLWLILTAAAALFLADLWLGLHTDSPAGNMYRGIGIALLLIWLMAEGFAFPLLARYTYSIGRLIFDSLRLAVTKPHITITHILLSLWLPALLWISPNAFMYCLPLWALFGGSASALVISTLLGPVQRDIEKKQAEAQGNE